MKRKKNATIRDVARLAGVSIATISRFLNDSAPLAKETARRVEQAMEELEFIPHPVARSLATQHTNTIGLLLLDIGGDYYTPLLRGIEEIASEAGLDLLIHSTRRFQAENRQRHALNEHNTDGLLVFVNALDTAEISRLNSIRFPVVLMHQSPPPNLDVPVVCIENREGTRQIVEHLITAHNRKRIAFLRGPENNEDSQAREEGYINALKKHNLPVDPNQINQGGFETEGAFNAVKQMLSNGIRFDGIFSGDDDSAVGVMDALKQAGLDVPADVSVVGFDDSVFARLITPRLTTVRAPIEQVGREAARQLIHLIRGEPASSQTILPTEMILRQSCGCFQQDSEKQVGVEK